MGTEIERKFLVAARPDWLSDCESQRIEQGYLARDESVEVRVRKTDSSRVLAIKSGHGLERSETEIELDEAESEELWKLTEGRRLAKRRYRRTTDEGKFEIDVYEDDLDGLITAEVEFDSEGESRAFTAPNWVSQEVTGDDGYSNYELAASGAPTGETS